MAERILAVIKQRGKHQILNFVMFLQNTLNLYNSGFFVVETRIVHVLDKICCINGLNMYYFVFVFVLTILHSTTYKFSQLI